MNRKNWTAILKEAAEIVNSYDTGVTLRQLFYRLVSRQILENTKSMYTSLSSQTAEARRKGTFPDFIDRTRSIHEVRSFDSPMQAKGWLSRIYRRDRQEGQPYQIYLGVEKNGIVEQLSAWFGRDYGIPILAFGGYASQTYVDDISRKMASDGRPSVLIYAGDFDPSGISIPRDFLARCRFDYFDRIALNDEQVDEYRLPENYGKESDTRANGFVKEFGRLCQVELDALEPMTLRGLYDQALGKYLDLSMMQAVIEREQAERESMAS
jgi:hypothetical protein